MGDLERYPDEYREQIASQVLGALQSRVEVENIKSFFDPTDEVRNDELRAQITEQLADGDEVWWFSTPFENLAGMAGYAIVSDGALKDFVIVVQS